MANIKSNKIKQKDNDPNWSTRTLLTNLRCTRGLRGWGGKQIHYCYHHSVPHRQKISKYYWFSGKKNIRNILIKFRFQQTVTDILSESKKDIVYSSWQKLPDKVLNIFFDYHPVPNIDLLLMLSFFSSSFPFLFALFFLCPKGKQNIPRRLP